MSATAGIDLGTILNGIGQFLSSFFNTLVQYAPLIMTVTVAGFLIYKYAGTVKRAIGQLVGFL